MRNKKSFILFYTITGIIVFLARCIETPIENNDPRGSAYAGSGSCRQCHQTIYTSYINTNHFKATQPALKKDILGSFSKGQNTYSYNADTKIAMEERNSGLYQVVYVNGKQTEAHRFDIIFGATHAQTFLYWQGNKTFELPVSYYSSAGTWATSPGYSSTEINFNRVVGKNCYECHSSYIESNLKTTSGVIHEELDKNSIVYGIDCERCHGPATNHVNFHLANLAIKEAKHIVSHRSLSRQQTLDQCAVCHSGNDKIKELSTFKFSAGDTLANFYSPWDSHNNTGKEIDVHGNQFQLLSESQCFLQSKSLTCSTCHDPHGNANKNVAGYSAKCISCHSNTDHGFIKNTTERNSIQTNCIDCHMPKQASRAISFFLEGSKEKSAYWLRTHKIAVYNNADKKPTTVIQHSGQSYQGINTRRK